MSVPRPKRQFAGAALDPSQRHIKEFFSTSDLLDDSRPKPLSSAPSTPSLPDHVQSNLLSVGMRVRKSIPEGYKTGSTFGSFQLWSDADSDPMTPPSSSAPAALSSETLLPHTTTPLAHGAAVSSRRELLPFCGIHRVGGHAAQPDTTTGPPPTSSQNDHVPGIDDVPSLTSSQESAASEASPARPLPAPLLLRVRTGRKRGYSEDGSGTTGGDAEEPPAPFVERPLGLGEWRPRKDWLDGEVSPRSWAPAGWENARVMAVPRRRKTRGEGDDGEGERPAARAGGDAGELAELGQENMAVDDFEEAAFLEYRYGEEMEVE